MSCTKKYPIKHTTSVTSKKGINVGVGVDFSLLKKIKTRFSSTYVSYGYNFLYEQVSAHSSNRTKIDLEKEVIVFALYPIRLESKSKGFDFNLGVTNSILLSEKVAGRSSSRFGFDAEIESREISKSISNKSFWGLQMRVGGKAKVSKKLFLTYHLIVNKFVSSENHTAIKSLLIKRIGFNLGFQLI